MPTSVDTYDCAIVGGGVAGLCLAIQLAQMQHSVILFEKNAYPFHKVCGEYVSNESWEFLERLGIPLSTMNLPQIDQLGISSAKGFMLEAPLKMGGFGISRFTLDHRLALLATQKGVKILENCKVNDVRAENGHYKVSTSGGLFDVKVVCGSYGKHSPVFMDKSLKAKAPNYIGVKYHIKTDLPGNRIELHNFKDGYCGISKVNDGSYCLCYLTTAENLNASGNSIERLEERVLMKNPYLERYFLNSKFLFDQPLTISQVTFNKKASYNNGVFLLGDSAGAIAPLCGNGMSMGMRASSLLAPILSAYLRNELTKEKAIHSYQTGWDGNFSSRIKAGYYLQQLLGKNQLTHASLKLLNSTPGLLQRLIALTHGNRF